MRCRSRPSLARHLFATRMYSPVALPLALYAAYVPDVSRLPYQFHVIFAFIFYAAPERRALQTPEDGTGTRYRILNHR